jgi:hypothetical protein
VVRPIVLVVITKSTLNYTNCGKTGHLMETCHNKKKKVPIAPIIIIKSIELVVKTKTQLVKLGKIDVRYPCLIYSNAAHRSGKCPKKIEVQNMLKTKHVNYNVTKTPKPLKTNNVPVNVVGVVTTHSQ